MLRPRTGEPRTNRRRGKPSRPVRRLSESPEREGGAEAKLSRPLPPAGRQRTAIDLSRPRRGSRVRHVSRRARAPRFRRPPPPPQPRTRAPGPRGGAAASAAASATPSRRSVRGSPAPCVSPALCSNPCTGPATRPGIPLTSRAGLATRGAAARVAAVGPRTGSSALRRRKLHSGAAALPGGSPPPAPPLPAAAAAPSGPLLPRL